MISFASFTTTTYEVLENLRDTIMSFASFTTATYEVHTFKNEIH